MLKRVDRVILRVPQLESALRHYHGTLGLPLVRKDKKVAVLKLLDSDAELVLHTDPDLPAEATYFLVDDVRDLYARRQALGLTFPGAPTLVARGYRAAGTAVSLCEPLGLGSPEMVMDTWSPHYHLHRPPFETRSAVPPDRALPPPQQELVETICWLRNGASSPRPAANRSRPGGVSTHPELQSTRTELPADTTRPLRLAPGTA